MNTRDQELLEWAARLIRSAQQEKTYGKVVVYLQNGVIERAELIRSEKPIKPTLAE
jgi:hypothetical protein